MYETQIERGVKWLNKNKPEWLDIIKIDNLDLGDGHSCVLGQTFDRHFSDVIEDGNVMAEEDAVMLGLSLGNLSLLEDIGENGAEQYSILTEEWIPVIKRERAKAEKAKKEAEEKKELEKYDVVFKMDSGSSNGRVVASKCSGLTIGTLYYIPTLIGSYLNGKVVKFV